MASPARVRADNIGMPLWGIVARSVAWALSALILVGTLAAPGSPLTVLHAAATTEGLVISGDLSGVGHGMPGSLVLTIRNGGAQPALVHTLNARITHAPASCPRNALVISSWGGALVVPAHGAASATLPVVLNSAEPGCAGATWQLAYASS